MADGYVKQVKDGLVTNLSNSATFQAWVGADNAGEALPFIHYGDTKQNPTLPCAVIENLVGTERVSVALDARVTSNPAVVITFIGKILASKVDADGQINDWEAVLEAIQSTVSNIGEEMESKSKEGGFGPNILNQVVAETQIDAQMERAQDKADNSMEHSLELHIEIGFREPEG